MLAKYELIEVTFIPYCELAGKDVRFRQGVIGTRVIGTLSSVPIKLLCTDGTSGKT